RLLLAQRPPTGLYGGLWELPQAVDRRALATAFTGRLTLATRPALRHRQLLTHRRLEIEVWPASLAGRPGRVAGYPRVAWHPVGGLAALALSTATRSVVDRILENPACRATSPKPSASSSKATRRSSRA